MSSSPLLPFTCHFLHAHLSLIHTHALKPPFLYVYLQKTQKKKNKKKNSTLARKLIWVSSKTHKKPTIVYHTFKKTKTLHTVNQDFIKSSRL
ncbi:hypothetical protein Hanom_Chr14g01307961 [Helianthus anomalus]